MKNGHYYIKHIPKEALEEFKTLVNQDYVNRDFNSYLKRSFYSFDDFVCSAFDFSKSKSGTEYWLNLKPVKITVIPEQPIYTPCPCGVSC